MNDRDTLIAMFDRAGIVWSEALTGEKYDVEGETGIEVGAHDGPNNLGYHGFASVFGFNADGSLRTVGSWE